MVKYTTPLPRMSLSEIDSKLYTKFEFCEGIEKHIDLQSQVIYVDKNNI